MKCCIVFASQSFASTVLSIIPLHPMDRPCQLHHPAIPTTSQPPFLPPPPPPPSRSTSQNSTTTPSNHLHLSIIANTISIHNRLLRPEPPSPLPSPSIRQLIPILHPAHIPVNSSAVAGQTIQLESATWRCRVLHEEAVVVDVAEVEVAGLFAVVEVG